MHLVVNLTNIRVSVDL
ncbi:uncharacterized protein CELE_ZC328.8 [Caenorhabditis elegans]|uniref:Uncharacterized protein n=1 Tax=Caenorhabditis elegans TaxID=6239 RepID=A0A2K5ATQ5_CAEEL|nr:Uncharacterized protein CELE_ZC328.8 [Caenorhabditis elegans]SPC47145.1 Uncharacterized protein CELE_ZC328.8 [Caenorhabditis elegans]|eukprot:NP_001348693.1 Uncharacterized protein CELE_ZC328.8 [Caenorhabditis elegans]